MSKNILICGGAGYVGSALNEHLSREHSINIVDLCWYSEPNLSMIRCNYNSLDRKFLDGFDVVILLAGLSSPEQCKLVSPAEVYDRNVQDFVDLTKKLNPKTQLIYASSASVSSGQMSREEDPFRVPVNTYDWSKQLLDQAARFVAPGAFGLRFGTLAGHSPNPRQELLLNSMVLSAIEEGIVRVNHQDHYRAVLWMQDLCRAVEAIINKPEATPGAYNISSLNGTIGDFAGAVSYLIGGEIQTLPDTGTFSFSLDTTKFTKEFDFKFTYDILNILEDCKRNREIINNSPGKNFKRNYLP